MVKGVIFDLDGTLIDTIEGLANSVNAAMDFYGFPNHSVEAYRTFVGNGVGKLVWRALPEDKKDLAPEAREIFEKHYAETMLDILPVYEGIRELLSYLMEKGIKIAVNTNKLDVFAKPMIKKVFGDIFCCVLGEVEHLERKPSPDGVNYILEKMCLTRDDCIYVGDSQVDIKTARNAGMRSITVTWGFATMEVLMENEPEVLVNHPREIIDWIERENTYAG
ncbi:MAG: HAD-IIIA family hydrolase [Clostridia bacterium]|nr:HAD-IIIA family hydrolase [Clostridia bacterium]